MPLPACFKVSRSVGTCKQASLALRNTAAVQQWPIAAGGSAGATLSWLFLKLLSPHQHFEHPVIEPLIEAVCECKQTYQIVDELIKIKDLLCQWWPLEILLAFLCGYFSSQIFETFELIKFWWKRALAGARPRFHALRG